jgi:hypothetical protein
MKKIAIFACFALCLAYLLSCNKENNVAESSENTGTFPPGITEFFSTESLTGNPEVILVGPCSSAVRNFTMRFKADNNCPQGAFTFPIDQMQFLLTNGGMPLPQAVQTIFGLYQNPVMGSPLLAHTAGAIIEPTLGLLPCVQRKCFNSISNTFNVNYTAPGYCRSECSIAAYSLGYSKHISPENCLVEMISNNSFKVYHSVTQQEQVFSFGTANDIVAAMINSGLTQAQVNLLLNQLRQGIVSAASFWDLMQRIIPYYPGVPNNPVWRIRSASFHMNFSNASVYYAICGDAPICFVE